MIKAHVNHVASLALCCLITTSFINRTLAMPSTEAANFSSTPTWSDEFNGVSLDLSKWQHVLGVHNNSDAVIVPEAVSVGNGKLTITTHTVDDGGTPEHRTGMIQVNDPYAQTRGYFEARIYFSDSPGMWSAYWMMPEHYGSVGYPGTEIDVVEHFAGDSSHAYTGVWWDGYGAGSHHSQQISSITRWNYHTYGLAWDRDSYRFYIDDQLRWTFTDKLSTLPLYTILSSEVADNSWAGNIPAGGYGDLAHSTTKMSVDYVRFYAPVPEPSAFVLSGIAAISVFGYTCRYRRTRRGSSDSSKQQGL